MAFEAKNEGASDSHPIRAIAGRYLLVTLCCPCYVDAGGKRYLDPLWAKDLSLHATYIKDLTIAVPRIDGDPPAPCVPWESWPLQAVRIVDLPAFPSFWSAIVRLPMLVAKLWEAISAAEIVHSGVAGWPFPDGWVTIPLARARRKFVVVVVESDFWRVSGDQLASLKKRWRASLSEVLNRWCVNLAHVSFFTHEAYKRSLLTRRMGRGHVIPASWVDHSILWSESEAMSQWQTKLQTRKGLRIVVVSRLVPEKGVTVLLEALGRLRLSPGEMVCDIVGEGPLLEKCKEIAKSLMGKVEITCLGRVEYGEPLFDLLAEYDAVVVPILSNEQPRIVYDAFARAVPVLGFATDGLASCVAHGVTGRLCTKGSVRDLADLLNWATVNRVELLQMGMAGLAVVRSLTHREMHRRRRDVLAPLIEAHAHG